MPFIFVLAIGTILSFQHAMRSENRVWEELTPMPEGRSGMVTFITEQSEPAYYGGSSWEENGKQIHASGYTLRNDEWHPLKTLKKPISYAAVACGKDKLFAVGGTDGSSIRPSLIFLKSSLQKKDIEIISSRARIYAGAALIDDVFYQVGGSTMLSPLLPSNTVCKFEQGTWSDVGELPEGSLINPAVGAWKSSFLVMGGGIPNSAGLNNTDSIYLFETTEGTWTKRTNLPAPTRGAVAISVPDSGILVIGGYIDPPGFTNQVLLFKPEKNEIISLASLPMGLMLPAVVASEEWIFVFGGEDAHQRRSNRVYRAGLSILL
jgi:N-acetylneuraminic acid mutarotase